MNKQVSDSCSGEQSLHQTINYLDQSRKQRYSKHERQFKLLAEPNPIRKRQKLHPHSIFSLLSLPDFRYPSEKDDVEPLSSELKTHNILECSLSSWNHNQLKLPLTQMPQIFQNPIYKYHQRVQCSKNQNIGRINANYSQSKPHQIPESTQTQRNILKIKDNEQQQSKQIQFESRFESGNLAMATNSHQSNSYNLAVCRDINTSKCTQWFFFRVSNSEPQTCTFHILNFIKSYSIFENGMKICVANEKDGYIWRRECEDIKYRKTNIPIYSNKCSGPYYYALSFTYTFKYCEDVVYFAYCYPYTYTMLESLLFNLSEKHENTIMKRRSIAESPGGNCVELITITNMKKSHEQESKKKMVVITSRVHPGETPSSFVCQGIMKYLLGNTVEAGQLRDHFVFKIVPMLNPDGVINGSYRCNLSGSDLNRVWHRANKLQHPEIYGAKKIIGQIAEKQKIFMFVDLHAHSKKKGVFMYGCQRKDIPYICRQIPFLMGKNIPQFNYYQCNFAMKAGREGTSRLYHSQSLQISYSYTMEHSFCGPCQSKTHFSKNMYLKIGQNFVLTLHKYFSKCIKQERSFNSLKIFKQLYSEKNLLEVGANEDASSSSDEELDQTKGKNTEQHRAGQIVMSRALIPQIRQCPVRSKLPSRTSLKIGIKESKTQELSCHKYSFYKKQLPVAAMLFKQETANAHAKQSEVSAQIREKLCFSTLADQSREIPLVQKLNRYRKPQRYEHHDQKVSLSDLFLPSVQSASYKNYHQKEYIKNMHASRSLIKDAIKMKQQIQPFSKYKSVNWRLL